MNILVTGGFGFIGSHLLELLLEDPENVVTVVDDLSTSPLPLPDLLDQIGRAPNLRYDIASVKDYAARHGDATVDQIYHLASIVGPAGVLAHAGRIVPSIVDDTCRLVEMAQRNGAKIVDVSTSEVYGGGQDGYCSEDMPKIVTSRTSARLEYAVGKLAAEVMVTNLCAAKQLNASIIRPFNVAGPRQSCRGGFVLPRFVTAALRREALTVFGDGRQIRAFTHGRDVARGIVLAMERGGSGEAYNVGNPENRCSILELAEAVIELSGSRSAITFVDPKAIFGPLYEEANDKYPDATKTMRELGWKPEFGKREIVLETIRYFQRLPERLFKHLEG